MRALLTGASRETKGHALAGPPRLFKPSSVHLSAKAPGVKNALHTHWMLG